MRWLAEAVINLGRAVQEIAKAQVTDAPIDRAQRD